MVREAGRLSWLHRGCRLGGRCEAREAGLGGRLYVDALRNHACVHILRRYANVIFREPNRSGGLSHAQCRLLNQYFDENLDRNISLAELAGVVGLSEFHFARKFRTEFSCPPHAHLMRSRPTFYRVRTNAVGWAYRPGHSAASSLQRQSKRYRETEVDRRFSQKTITVAVV